MPFSDPFSSSILDDLKQIPSQFVARFLPLFFVYCARLDTFFFPPPSCWIILLLICPLSSTLAIPKHIIHPLSASGNCFFGPNLTRAICFFCFSWLFTNPAAFLRCSRLFSFFRAWCPNTCQPWCPSLKTRRVFLLIFAVNFIPRSPLSCLESLIWTIFFFLSFSFQCFPCRVPSKW